MADVLITRPIAQAQSTARHIERRLLRPHIVPLVEIVPLPEFPTDFMEPDRKFDALLATSSHAFHAAREELAALKGLPLFCVGSRTAQAAKNAGFCQIKEIAANAEQLVCHLSSYPPYKFLYLAGKVRRAILEQQLVIFGHQVSVLELYRQNALRPDGAALARLPPRFDVALFYCVTAARAASLLAQFFDSKTRFLCLSERIGEALPPALHSFRRIAPHPNEICLLDLL